MSFLKLLSSGAIGVPSVLAIIMGVCGVLWGFPLIIAKAFGIAVVSWGWALFGIPLVAIMCVLLVIIGSFGIAFVNELNK